MHYLAIFILFTATLSFYNYNFSTTSVTDEKEAGILIAGFTAKKIIAKKIIQTTGRNTYLSVRQLPLITVQDIVNFTVTGITYTAFSKIGIKKTAILIGAELGLLKKGWHRGVNNSHVAITAIDKWAHRHQKIISWSQFILAETIFSINSGLLEKLLCSISQSSNK